MITAIQKYAYIQTRAKRKNENSCVRDGELEGELSFLLFHFLYCGDSILFCEIKRNHGVYMQQLNSNSKDEPQFWETNMLIWGMV